MDDQKLKYYESLVDDYLNGKLSDQKSKELQEAAQSSDHIRAYILNHVESHAEIRTLAEKIEKERFLKKLAEDRSDIKPILSIRKWLIPIAASVIVMIGAGTFLWNNNNNHDILDLTLDPPSTVLRSNNNPNSNDIWNSAMASLQNKEYQDAYSFLKDLQGDTSFTKEHSGKYYLYTAVCELRLEQYNSAITSLMKIRQDNPFYDQAQWYLSVTYYNKGDNEKARSLLHNIVKQAEHYKNKEAQNLLNQLR